MLVVAVWLMLTAALVGILVIVNIVSAVRWLSAQGVPSPLLVIYQRTMGRLLPARIEPIETFIGRTALLSWDVRWVTSGNTLARVTGADSIGDQLTLHLSKPIVLYATDKAPELHIENVQFKPKVRGRCAYGKRAVSGHLSPPIMEGLYATASIVIYPDRV